MRTTAGAKRAAMRRALFSTFGSGRSANKAMMAANTPTEMWVSQRRWFATQPRRRPAPSRNCTYSAMRKATSTLFSLPGVVLTLSLNLSSALVQREAQGRRRGGQVTGAEGEMSHEPTNFAAAALDGRAGGRTGWSWAALVFAAAAAERNVAQPHRHGADVPVLGGGRLRE